MSSQRKTEGRIWFITGISRGFGYELTQYVLNQGDTVIGTTRTGSVDGLQHPHFHVLKLDVANHSDIRLVVDAAYKIYNRLDIVVNNAGLGIFGAIEEVSLEKAKRIFDVNVWGTYVVMQAVLPYLRQQRSGHIMNISSVGGIASGIGGGVYCATKHAVEALSESLAQEVEQFGIKITIIEPGYFRSDFLTPQSVAAPDHPMPEYNYHEHYATISGKQPGDVKKGVAAIYKMSLMPNPPIRLFLGSDAYQTAKSRGKHFIDIVEQTKELTLSTDYDTVSEERKDA